MHLVLKDDVNSPAYPEQEQARQPVSGGNKT
jgi:hypothetical protein